jgi:hypothetical protein
MHTIRYKYDPSFPDDKELELTFHVALLKAMDMWERSGKVQFSYSISSLNPIDFTITWELIGREYGDVTQKLYSPDISYRSKTDQDVCDTNLIINCDTKWRTKWYHLFRKEFNPVLIAHNLGHLMGICTKRHSRDPDSVMYELPTKEPNEKDFQLLSLALSKRIRKE